MRKIWILSSLIMILVTLYQINNTYAKYYTEANGTVEETIGSWIVKLNDTNIATENTEESFTIETLQYDNTENVLEGKIAPGSTGYFDIVIDATEASVAVIYDIIIDISELEINSAMGINKVTTLVDGVENESGMTRTAESTYTGIISLADVNAKKTNTARVYIEWVEDETGANDEQDISLGKVKDTEFSIPVTVKASQYLGENIVEYSEN